MRIDRLSGKTPCHFPIFEVWRNSVISGIIFRKSRAKRQLSNIFWEMTYDFPIKVKDDTLPVKPEEPEALERPVEATVLLAVDLGMRAGLAWFDRSGRLIRARSTHFRDRATLKRALPGIWREVPGVTHLLVEGGGELADIWLKSASRQGFVTMKITAEQWRREVFSPSQLRNAQSAKAAARARAAEIARQDGCPPCREYLDDAAEAVVFGKWYSRKIFALSSSSFR